MKKFIHKALSRLYRLFRTTKRKKIIFWRPSNIRISRQARIQIDEQLEFNMPWNKKNKCTLGEFFISDTGSLYIKNVSIYSGCTIAINGHFSMKSGYINNNSKVFCRNRITIGENVVIAPEVIIRDSDQHQVISPESETQRPISAPVTIGDHVWIGTRSIILKGVSIGSHVIVAAGSVVTHDIPDHCLAAGVPAKVIKRNIDWK